MMAAMGAQLPHSHYSLLNVLPRLSEDEAYHGAGSSVTSICDTYRLTETEAKRVSTVVEEDVEDGSPGMQRVISLDEDPLSFCKSI